MTARLAIGAIGVIGVLLAVAPAQGQTASAGVSGWGMGFVAPGAATNGYDWVSTLHFGGGGAATWSSGLGFNAEIGYVSALESIEEGTGLLSAGALYQFRRASRTRPFVTGGYSLFFANSDGHAHAFHFGGGVDHWLSDRVGLMFEVRDYVLPEDFNTNLLQFRIGLLFR
jgi:hypothetical protein